VVTDGSAAGFDTSGNPSGTDAVPTPTQGTTQRYGIDCDGATDTIDIEVNPQPNLTGGIAVTGLTPSTTPSGDFTGSYTAVEVTVPYEEVGGVDVNTSFVIRVELDINNDGGPPDEWYEWPSIPNIAANTSPLALQHTFSGLEIPATPNSRVTAYIDYNNTVPESDDNNTYFDDTFPGGLPAINMTLDIIPSDFVRGGQTAVLDWDTNAVFPMNCTLDGPALSAITFNPSTDGPTGSATTGPINSKSVYELSCEEQVMPPVNTIYTATTSIETTGTIEEI
jgi:hypothetical protein